MSQFWEALAAFRHRGILAGGKICGHNSDALLAKREIKLTKSCRSRRNPLKSSKLQQIEANRFLLHFSLFVCSLSELSSICTTFLLRSNGTRRARRTTLDGWLLLFSGPH